MNGLLPPKAYAAQRAQHRARMMAHRRARTLGLRPHTVLQFEDRHTVRYQIQEMLRAEGIEDADGIREQIETYAPLLPDGGNWKATLMLQVPEAGLRRTLLQRLPRMAHHVYVEVEGHAPVYALANEDLPAHDHRPSSVHFLRFELPAAARHAVAQGRAVSIGCAHPEYTVTARVPSGLQQRLSEDFSSSSRASEPAAHRP